MSNTTVTLEPGSLACVPLQGVCQVLNIEESEILGQRHRFFVLETQEEKVLVKVPEKQLESQGIRPLMSADLMQTLLEKQLEVEVPQGRPHLRVRKWTSLLRTGEFGCRRQVLAELQAIEDGGGRLSKQEAALKERVRQNLEQEIALVLGLSRDQAGDRLNLCLSLSKN